MAEYRLAPAAERDLERIWRHTLAEWGQAQADHYTDVLVAAFLALAAAPNSAPACHHIRPGYRRRHVERHTIYFRITAYGIVIVRILHDRMEPSRRL